MNRDPQTTFTRIGDVLARHAIPKLRRAARLPLRVACIGVASYDCGGEVDGFDRTVVVGQGASPEEAMCLAKKRVSCGDIRVGVDDTLRFRPRLAVINDRDNGLVLAGAIRGGRPGRARIRPRVPLQRRFARGEACRSRLARNRR